MEERCQLAHQWREPRTRSLTTSIMRLLSSTWVVSANMALYLRLVVWQCTAFFSRWRWLVTTDYSHLLRYFLWSCLLLCYTAFCFFCNVRHSTPNAFPFSLSSLLAMKSSTILFLLVSSIKFSCSPWTAFLLSSALWCFSALLSSPNILMREKYLRYSTSVLLSSQQSPTILCLFLTSTLLRQQHSSLLNHCLTVWWRCTFSILLTTSIGMLDCSCLELLTCCNQPAKHRASFFMLVSLTVLSSMVRVDSLPKYLWRRCYRENSVAFRLLVRCRRRYVLKSTRVCVFRRWFRSWLQLLPSFPSLSFWKYLCCSSIRQWAMAVDFLFFLVRPAKLCCLRLPTKFTHASLSNLISLAVFSRSSRVLILSSTKYFFSSFKLVYFLDTSNALRTLFRYLNALTSECSATLFLSVTTILLF